MQENRGENNDQEPVEQTPPQETLSSIQPVASGRAPISEDRRRELKKVFGDFSITGGVGEEKQETIGFTPEEVESIVADEQIQYYLPKTIESFLSSNFIKNTDNFQIPLSSWKEAALKNPALFIQKPETVNHNIEDSAAKLGVAKNIFVEAALKQPSLFSSKPETVNHNIEDSADKLGIAKDVFVEAALKQPSLFSQKPETLNTNIEGSADKLGIAKDVFVEAALKHPSLFGQKPETLNANIEESAAKLGVAKDVFVEAALKQPQLFGQKPETLNANIEESATRLGVAKNAFIEAALRQPPLFYQKPETLNANIEASAARLGVAKNIFVEAALKQPSLFSSKPETTENKYNMYKKLLSGNGPEILTKYPQILSYAPEKILSHYVLSKMLGKEIKMNIFTKNSLSLAETELTPEYLELFKPAYNYLTTLSKKMRLRSRKRGEETKTYEQMTDFVEKFFGKKDKPLTKDMLDEFKIFIAKHVE